MTSSHREYDYEAIMNKFIKKDVTSGQLEGKKNDLDAKHWNSLCEYYEAKGKFECAETTANEMCNLHFNKIKARSNIDLEHSILKEKLENLLSVNEDLKMKNKKETDVIHSKIDELWEKIQQLPYDFDNDNINTQIHNHIEAINLIEQRIMNLKAEQELKDSMQNIEPEILNIQLTKVIKKEGREEIENPAKANVHLVALHRDITFLKNKIRDYIIKNSI